MRQHCPHLLVRLLLLVILCLPLASFGTSDGPPAGYAGNPPNNRTCVQCHTSYPLNGGIGGVGFGAVPSPYSPSTLYNLHIVVGHQGREHWGYQLTILDANNESAGIFLPPDSGSVLSDQPAPLPDYVGQSLEGNLPGATYGSWHVPWMSPPEGTGPVTAYLTGVAADGNGLRSYDYVYSMTYIFNEGQGDDTDPHPYIIENYHDFGYVPVGQERTFSTPIYNVGAEPFTINDIIWAHGVHFAATSPAPGTTVNSGDFVLLTLEFSSQTTGRWADELALDTSFGIVDTFFACEAQSTRPLAPLPFDLASPEDGEIVGGSQLQFTWHPSVNLDSTDQNPDYQLHIDTESDFFSADTYFVGQDTSYLLPGDQFNDSMIYFWRVLALDTNTDGTLSNQEWAFLTDFTNVTEGNTLSVPGSASPLLVDIWPNPFNEKVNIQLELLSPTHVTVEIFDLLGRRVAQLNNGILTTGEHRFDWSAQTVSSGIYLLRVTMGTEHTIARKLVYMR